MITSLFKAISPIKRVNIKDFVKIFHNPVAVACSTLLWFSLGPGTGGKDYF